jgi:hypothetical protein
MHGYAGAQPEAAVPDQPGKGWGTPRVAWAI